MIIQKTFLSRSFQVNCIFADNKCSLGKEIKILMSTKYTAVDIPEIKQELESQKLKHKHHPGKRNIRCVVLPDQLVSAVKRLLINHNKQQLLSDSKTLNNVLKSRKLPVEDNELRNIAKKFEAEILLKENLNLHCVNDDDEKREKHKNQILSQLRKRVYHWKPLEYDRYSALLYITRRLAPEYAALTQVFMEVLDPFNDAGSYMQSIIAERSQEVGQKNRLVTAWIAMKHHDPSFSPKHLFDFGSGIGSVLWVAHSMWGQHIKDYCCIDSSSDMIDTSQLLLQDGRVDAEMFVKGVFFRQFLPVSNLVTYDLVVSSYSLMELPSAEYRLQVIDNLWKKCNKYLVIIEHGSNAGYTAVIEARDYILKLEADEATRSGGAQVIAPCPHDLSCPRFTDGTQTPCNFEVLYHELPLDHRVNINSERFSYVIIKKEPRAKGSKDSWPRVVRQILPRSKHVVCRMCCADGQLHEIIFTKHKHGRHLYKCVKSSQWGDVIPATVVSSSQISDITEES